MNASPQSPSQKHHPHLERGALTLLTLASLFAIWLGIGLPGFPALTGGAAEAGGRDTLVAQLDTGAPRRHAAPPQRVQSRLRARSQLHRTDHAAPSRRTNELRGAPAPAAPTPKQVAATQPRQPEAVTPTSPPPAPQAAPKAPAAPAPPAPPPAPSPPTPSDPVQTTIDVVQQAAGDVQKTVGDVTAAVPTASQVQQTVQNAVPTVTNAVPQLPKLP